MKKAKQCRAKRDLLYKGQCQGCSGHKGHHWFYEPHGSLFQWANNKDPKSKNSGSKLMKKYGGFGCSITPPDHKSWVHPKRMYKLAYHWCQFNHLKMFRKGLNKKR